MQSILPTLMTLTLTLTLLAEVTGYKRGPPVDEHPEICGSMSPKLGHEVDPLNTPAPFTLTIVSPSGDCYSHGEPTVVKLVSTNNRTHFEGFLVQARLASAAGSPLQLESVVLDGTFGTNGDPQLQTLKCGTNAAHNNSLGHKQAKRYYEKTFTWEPSDTFTADIQFVATVVHEQPEYWKGVTSSTLRFDEHCLHRGGRANSQTLPSALALIVSLVSGLLMT